MCTPRAAPAPHAGQGRFQGKVKRSGWLCALGSVCCRTTERGQGQPFSAPQGRESLDSLTEARSRESLDSLTAEPTWMTSALQKFLKSCSPSRACAACCMAPTSREPSCTMKYLYWRLPQLNLQSSTGHGGTGRTTRQLEGRAGGLVTGSLRWGAPAVGSFLDNNRPGSSP